MPLQINSPIHHMQQGPALVIAWRCLPDNVLCMSNTNWKHNHVHVALLSMHCAMLQEVRQRRLEGDKEMYARRLELQRIEAQQKAQDATRR